MPRREGETAFPDIARILEAVRAVIRASRPSVEQAAASRWLEYIDKCKAEGIEKPDEETLAKINGLNSRFNLEKPQELIIGPPAMVECPHCGGTLPLAKNLRFFSSLELRMLADLVEKSEQISAANRAAVHEPETEIVEAITEEVA